MSVSRKSNLKSKCPSSEIKFIQIKNLVLGEFFIAQCMQSMLPQAIFFEYHVIVLKQ
jgi:hypothetical protein